MAMSVVDGPKIALSGALSKTDSVVSPTSATNTVTVNPGNPGQIRFANLVVDSGTPQYSKNGGAFTTISDPTTVVFASGNTLAVKGLSMTSATSITFDAIDVATGRRLEAVIITRT